MSLEVLTIISNPPYPLGKKVVHQVIERHMIISNPRGDLSIVIPEKKTRCSVSYKLDGGCVWQCWNVKKAKGYYILEVRNYEEQLFN